MVVEKHACGEHADAHSLMGIPNAKDIQTFVFLGEFSEISPPPLSWFDENQNGLIFLFLKLAN